MIEYKSGDILNDAADAIVNTVNCVGIMGRGIALQFKKAYPENFKAYVAACNKNEIRPGKMFVFPTSRLTPPRFIINFPTKRHWRGKSRLEDIDSGLKDLVHVIFQNRIRSIAIPPLGSGLGGLNWDIVRQKIETALRPLENISIIIYKPNGAPDADKMVRWEKSPEMTPSRAALIGLIRQYLSALIDPFVTLLEIHKLMYFLSVSGQKLRLHFVKGKYGPYAKNLSHVLNQIESYFIKGYADGGDDPSKKILLTEDASVKAERLLGQDLETQARFKRVVDLVDGFESPMGLELLATVHWVVKNESPKSRTDLFDCIHNWNTHKKIFTRRQIDLTLDTLIHKKWLNE